MDPDSPTRIFPLEMDPDSPTRIGPDEEPVRRRYRIDELYNFLLLFLPEYCPVPYRTVVLTEQD